MAMKIPLKYGLLATLGVAAWVLITRSLIIDPKSAVHTLGAPIFFNVFHFALIYLGLKALEREKRDRPTFKELLKTGVGISLVYALTVSLFFVGVVAVVGTKWLSSEPAAADVPMSRLMIGSFIGLFIGGPAFGLLHFALISLLL